MASRLSKTINAWCSYDIANSAYKLLMNTALFPIYYKAVTGEYVSFFGTSLKNTVAYDYALALAFLVIAFVSPLLSGIADYGGHRKRFMQFFTFLGATACIGMYWFDGDNMAWGFMMVIFAAMGYEGAVLFYDSFLPRIAPPRLHDKISARGYAWGFAGSMVLLGINLVLIMNFESIGFETKLEPVRLSFLQVGFWWFAFSWIAFTFLKDNSEGGFKTKQIFKKGYQELMGVQKKLFNHIITRRFLFSFFFYSMGLKTIMLVAIMFGQQEIGVEGSKLIVTILILQFLAIVGAIFFARISERFGNKQSLIAMLFIWLAACIGGYLVQTVVQFYLLAGAVGLVMGGIQSQSRSTFSKLIPSNSNDTASYFSFYNFTDKIAIVLGMFSFGFIEHLTGSSRNSVIALGVYFIVALLIMWRTPLNKLRNKN